MGPRTFSAMTTTSLSLISGIAVTSLSIQSASFRFNSANSFQIFWTSSLLISSTSESVPMVSQSSSSSPLTQYGISVRSSTGTILEITTLSGSAPGSDLTFKWPPSCFKCSPLLLPHLVCPLPHPHPPSSSPQTSHQSP